MSRPKNDIEKALRTTLPLKSALLLAVSGGKDSIALLHACASLKDKMRLRIGVAHIDHSLRVNSKKDAKFVEKTAKELDLEFFSIKIKKTNKKDNTEDWGRKERYKFLTSVLKKKNFDWILTAHTANDVAETFLIRLLSNKELNSIEAVDRDRKLLRPLLLVSTEEILEYLKRNKVKYVEDETNIENVYLRNKIRNKLLPILKKDFDARIVETLSERSLALYEDIKGLVSLLEAPLKISEKYDFGSKPWLRSVKKSLEDMPEFLSWRFAENLLKPILGFNLGRARSKELVQLLNGEIQGMQLPQGIALRLKSGGLALIK